MKNMTLGLVVLSLVTHSAFAFAEESKPSDSKSPRGEWQTLFDGSSLDAWREYGHPSVTTGWKIDGDNLVCIAKKDQGEGARNENLITKEKFGAFVLELEFKVTPAANSGVLFHVLETDKPPYYTGPEFQIQDHVGGHDPQKCGWLYQLYAADTDAAKPAGQWNKLKIRITPKKSVSHLNGVKYAEFVKGSDDWNERVAKSKFGKWEGFGEADSGYICLQDHNDEVAFRNIRVRRLD
ncbi:3-keto-disaccharide hydrolase [Allorhodopirellula solitaria]|uniref:3-keto-alpha-glucoside-1,2-lyase/3-keto-2-hydroxy-glucal hydratase domain-containing protein n=1 Tax=Allorhodopirellula solitaria TaxID=2527987 RepID=A0A5C5YI40_9BACT|nr:DUF1080 domain-containing protein [Allorhodopirellula solitaria]TWT74242.1 hypothetical protein CA85_11290 [Allorhodopirellula solitaria]